MRKDYTEIIAAVEAEATALQAEIDAAIDEHGVLRRFVDELRGPAAVVQWTPTTIEVPRATNEAFALVDSTPPKRAVKAKPVAKKQHRNGKVDYEAVAKWINEHKANGTYSVVGLADAFGMPTSTVKNWAGTCKQRGLLTDEVAASLNTAKVTHAPAPAPPAPSDRPVVKTDGPTQPMLGKRPHVLACSECDFECATSEFNALSRHCLTTHDRRPSNEERMPVLAGAA